jgi:hypothetical protein
MPATDQIEACKDVVVGFCTAINDWDTVRCILGRIENGQYLIGLQREAVEGITVEDHNKKHVSIFQQFVVPRERKFGSNPGSPTSWGTGGSFFDVDRDSIDSVEFPTDDRAEIVAPWGYQLPGGSTMFVLSRTNGSWLIDNLKIRGDNCWEGAHL